MTAEWRALERIFATQTPESRQRTWRKHVCTASTPSSTTVDSGETSGLDLLHRKRTHATAQIDERNTRHIQKGQTGQIGNGIWKRGQLILAKVHNVRATRGTANNNNNDNRYYLPSVQANEWHQLAKRVRERGQPVARHVQGDQLRQTTERGRKGRQPVVAEHNTCTVRGMQQSGGIQRHAPNLQQVQLTQMAESNGQRRQEVVAERDDARGTCIAVVGQQGE